MSTPSTRSKKRQISDQCTQIEKKKQKTDHCTQIEKILDQKNSERVIFHDLDKQLIVINKEALIRNWTGRLYRHFALPPKKKDKQESENIFAGALDEAFSGRTYREFLLSVCYKSGIQHGTQYEIGVTDSNQKDFRFTEWKNGVKHGTEYYYTNNKLVYKCDWVNNCRHGTRIDFLDMRMHTNNEAVVKCFIKIVYKKNTMVSSTMMASEPWSDKYIEADLYDRTPVFGYYFVEHKSDKYITMTKKQINLLRGGYVKHHRIVLESIHNSRKLIN